MKLIGGNQPPPKKKRVAQRRDYVSVGSNWCWHIDGHDKLKKYGFAIHAAIDGFSRRILWCHNDSTNNDPVYIAKYYYDFVVENQGLMLGRKTASWQVVKCTWKAQISHDYGTSMKNQRIEAYWSIQRHRNSIFWEQLFKAFVTLAMFPGQVTYSF
ncbi:predicted protein [Nematostella vectensis]|uniref:Integrase core domain-containing protein n=1 Tax=Nematostella vectensis TaxID=45351 RepID=A7SMI8_NEMVE|nr:predicted protein [Nematostella vectensis]|eukprot:XP_001627181.1 predicted protein [Nematostella vectensis]